MNHYLPNIGQPFADPKQTKQKKKKPHKQSNFRIYACIYNIYIYMANLLILTDTGSHLFCPYSICCILFNLLGKNKVQQTARFSSKL